MSDAAYPTMKQWLHFWLAIVLSTILVSFGSRLLFSSGSQLNSTVLVGVGLALMIGGLLTIGKGGMRTALVILPLGFYCLLRATGVLEMSWLSWIVGIFSWLAAGWLLYKTWPGRLSRDARDRMDGYDIPD